MKTIETMDEKLQQIFKIQPLQATVIAYRSSTAEYRKMIKHTCVSELKNLVNVEMSIDQVELKVPEEKQVWPSTTELRKTKIGCLLKECSVVEGSLNLL